MCAIGAWVCYLWIDGSIQQGIMDIAGLDYVNKCGDQFTKLNKDIYIRKMVLASSSLFALKVLLIFLLIFVLITACCHIPLMHGQYEKMDPNVARVHKENAQRKKEALAQAKKDKQAREQAQKDAQAAKHADKAQKGQAEAVAVNVTDVADATIDVPMATLDGAAEEGISVDLEIKGAD